MDVLHAQAVGRVVGVDQPQAEHGEEERLRSHRKQSRWDTPDKGRAWGVPFGSQAGRQRRLQLAVWNCNPSWTPGPFLSARACSAGMTPEPMDLDARSRLTRSPQRLLRLICPLGSLDDSHTDRLLLGGDDAAGVLHGDGYG